MKLGNADITEQYQGNEENTDVILIYKTRSKRDLNNNNKYVLNLFFRNITNRITSELIKLEQANFRQIITTCGEISRIHARFCSWILKRHLIVSMRVCKIDF